jgi:hypothetical protein
MTDAKWGNVGSIGSREFTCGFCGYLVASDRGYYAGQKIDGLDGRIFVCPHCSKPTFFLGETPTPGVAPGQDVEHVPKDLHALYDEARRSVSVSAYTASVLASRKMLMNIAVANGGEAGLTFVDYVAFLADKNFVPPNGRGWVDHIRKKGNEATHEIALMSQADAMELIAFVEMLLTFIYEFPARVPKPL